MGFELIATGLSAIGSVTGLHSWVSGFSLARDVKAILKNQEQLLRFERDVRKGTLLHDRLADATLSALRDFRAANEPEQWQALLSVVASLASSSENKEINRGLLDSVVIAMQQTIASVKFEKAPALELPHNLLSGLVNL